MSIQEDNKGHKLGIHLHIRAKIPMTTDGFNQWSRPQRIHINKSRYVWKYIGYTKEKYPNGVPTSILGSNEGIANFLMDNYPLTPGVTYTLQGISAGKTRTKRKFSKTLARIIIHDLEKRSYIVWGTGILSRYWFRSNKQKEKEMR